MLDYFRIYPLSVGWVEDAIKCVGLGHQIDDDHIGRGNGGGVPCVRWSLARAHTGEGELRARGERCWRAGCAIELVWYGRRDVYTRYTHHHIAAICRSRGACAVCERETRLPSYNARPSSCA